MNMKRFAAWLLAMLMLAVSVMTVVSWLRADAATRGSFDAVLGFIAVPGILASLLVFFLVVSGRGLKRLKAKEAAKAAEQEVALKEIQSQALVEIKPVHALLKPDERAYANLPVNLMETKTIGYSAGSTGVSVRVVKGVTLRTGATRGQAVKDMVPVATGELVITNKRVIFAGDKKSFAMSLSELINAAVSGDDLIFHDDKSSYTLRTYDSFERRKFSIIMEKLIRT